MVMVVGGLGAILKSFFCDFCSGSNAAVVYENILLILVFFGEEGERVNIFLMRHDIGYGITGRLCLCQKCAKTHHFCIKICNIIPEETAPRRCAFGAA